MSPEEKLLAMRELQESRGWAIMREYMRSEIDIATRQLVGSPMHADELNRRNGAIWAGYQLLDLPSRITALLENERVMKRAEELSKRPAKAGQGEDR